MSILGRRRLYLAQSAMVDRDAKEKEIDTSSIKITYMKVFSAEPGACTLPVLP